MTLLYPFITTAEGIKTNVLGKDILFKFILPPMPKEIYLLDKISISNLCQRDFLINCQSDFCMSFLKNYSIN